jgi:hypothetical protein
MVARHVSHGGDSNSWHLTLVLSTCIMSGRRHAGKQNALERTCQWTKYHVISSSLTVNMPHQVALKIGIIAQMSSLIMACSFEELNNRVVTTLFSVKYLYSHVVGTPNSWHLYLTTNSIHFDSSSIAVPVENNCCIVVVQYKNLSLPTLPYCLHYLWKISHDFT